MCPKECFLYPLEIEANWFPSVHSLGSLRAFWVAADAIPVEDKFLIGKLQWKQGCKSSCNSCLLDLLLLEWVHTTFIAKSHSQAREWAERFALWPGSRTQGEDLGPCCVCVYFDLHWSHRAVFNLYGTLQIECLISLWNGWNGIFVLFHAIDGCGPCLAMPPSASPLQTGLHVQLERLT